MLDVNKIKQARWESRSGKHWVEVYTDRYGATYQGPDCGGNLGNITALEAVLLIQSRVDRGDFQPDKAKLPMSRVN